MMRPSQDQCLDVSKFCVEYLHDKFSNEKNLFRSGVSQTDVRTLQAQIIQFSATNKPREELDPHLISEVLIKSFKDMAHPLFYEVYEDILGTELNDNDFEMSRDNIQKWIVKLPEDEFMIASGLFRLLSKLAALDDNESSLLQLSYCISPTICRPITSAYMSIRHMEDLKKIRPVVSFIIENYDDLFVFDLKPVKSYAAAVIRSRNPSITGTSIHNLSTAFSTSTSMMVDASPGLSKQFSGSLSDPVSPVNDNRSFGLLRPNLLVMIPPTQIQTESDMDVEGAGGSGTNLQPPGHHYTDAEWNILEAVILGQVCLFVDSDIGRDVDVHRVYRSTSNDSTGSPSAKGLFNSSPSPTRSSSSVVKLAAASSSSSPKGNGSTGNLFRTNSAPVEPNNKVNQRRKMVADCKAMRSQIFEFEQEWTRKHNRIPKTYERGGMQVVYTKYRDLKKDIRNLAAVDLQRMHRGYMVRSKSSGSSSAGNKADRMQLAGSGGSGSFFEESGGAGDSSRSQASNRMVVSPVPSSQVQLQPLTLKGTPTKPVSVSSAAADSLYGKYRELLTSKRDLKRRLKKFDEDFVEQHGRQPKKIDKEVIRPMYQKYHEVKSSLDELKLQIEQSHGPLPDDLLEESGGRTSLGGATGLGDSGNLSVSMSSPHSGGGRGGGGTDSESENLYGVNLRRESSGNKYLSSDDEGGTSPQPHGSHRNAASVTGASPVKVLPPSVTASDGSLDALLLEKTNLHAFLKVYERDFNRQHGRPVMKQEDIQPVAHEYQRYKELKVLIRDMKHK